METRKYKDKEISLLGFGCMRLPLLEDEKNIDYDLGYKMVDYAYENKVNYFDTAYPYHGGMSEVFIGKALKKYPRDSYYLANKMPSFLIMEPSDGERIFSEQLNRCQEDHFDFYLCHAIGKSLEDFVDKYEKTKIIDYLFKLKEKGIIGNLGFSFHGVPDRLDDIIKRHDWDFVQIQLNYLDWELQNAKRQYEIIKDHGLPCIIMEPVRGGNLSHLCEESEKLLKTKEPSMSIASWAIRFAASLPNAITVLSGMTAMDQVVDNVATISNFKPLNAEDYEILSKVVEIYLKDSAIPCTGCRYCMDCPSGVDIPKVFSVYNECATTMHIPVSFDNQHNLNKYAQEFLNAYKELPEESRANHCISCKKCMDHCPQGIEIPARMKEISKLVASLK